MNEVSYTGTGNPVKDTRNVNDINSDLISKGGGRIKLVGEVHFDEIMRFGDDDAAVSVVGLHPMLTRVVLHKASKLVWPDMLPAFSSPSMTGGQLYEGQRFWHHAKVSGSPVSRGDYVIIWSEDKTKDQIKGAANQSGQGHLPGEIHRVAQYNASTGDLILDGSVIDSMSNLNLKVMRNYSNFEVGNFSVAANTNFSSSECIVLRMARDFVVRDILFEDKMDACTSLVIYGCMNGLVENIRSGQDAAVNNSYSKAIVVNGASNKITVNNVISGIKHHVIDTGAQNFGDFRVGTVRDVKFNNIHVEGYYDKVLDKEANEQLWQHESGWNIEYHHCTVSIANKGAICGGSRARNVLFNDCHFRGDDSAGFNGIARGLEIQGSGTRIQGCTFEGLWQPIWARPAPGGVDTSYGAIVSNNTFLNCRTGIDAGDNWTIEKNSFPTGLNGKHSGTPKSRPTPIQVDSHKIENIRINRNDMPYRGVNEAAIAIYAPSNGNAPQSIFSSIHGNSVDGYPSNEWIKSGVKGTNRADSGLMQTWNSKNYL